MHTFLTTILLAATLSAPPAAPGDAPAGPKTPQDASKPDQSPTGGHGGTQNGKQDGKQDGKQETPAKPAAAPLPKPPTVVGPNDVLHVKPQQGLPREKYTIFGETYDCELCLDTESRNAGMGARTEFPAGTAMIFVHPFPGLLSYWMKDCLIDMDMVMLDSQGIICATHEATREKLRTTQEPLEAYHNRLHRYSSNRRAKFVIEFPAGTLARVKPVLGQRVDIDWKALERRAK